MVLPTIADLPLNEKNCATCRRTKGVCPRTHKRYPNGYVMNSVTGEIGGIIVGCNNWTGETGSKQLTLF